VTTRHALPAWRGDHEGLEFWISPAELQQAFQSMNVKAAGFDFDCPVAPGSFKNSVDFERLLPGLMGSAPAPKDGLHEESTIWLDR
jgi:hypothetical protein